MRHQTNSGFGMQGRIDARTHSEEQLRAAADDYDSLTRQEKLQLTREVEPQDEVTFYNVTTDQLHEYFVDNLDPGNTSAEANVGISHLALGTGGDGLTPSTSDTDLNNRVYSEPVTDIADNVKDIVASTFIGSDEANGNDIDELGLYTGDPANLANADVFLMNHAIFAAITKDSSSTLTFDVTLSFSDA